MAQYETLARPTGGPQDLIFGSFKNKKFAERICLEDVATGQVLNYGEMDDETALAAGILKGLGISRGQTVSLLLENGLHFFMPWLGAMRVGSVANPINCLLPDADIIYAIDLCQTRLLVTQERYVWDGGKNGPSALFNLIREKFPELKILVMPDPQNFKTQREPKPYREKGAGYLGTYGWNKISQFCKPQYYVEYRDLNDPFQLICTSGTTGRPKAVVQHCGMFLPNVRDIIKTYGLSGEDRALLINRLFHVNAQVTNVFPMFLLGGAVILGSPEPSEILKTVSEKETTFSSMIPPTLNAILKHYEKNGGKIPPKSSRKKMRFIIVGADILRPELHKKFMESTGIRIPSGWGMTETMCWGTGTALGDPIYWGSIGRAFSDFEVKIVDPEKNWEEAAHNQWGRLIVRGHNVFKEYFRNPEATKKAFAPSVHWGEGWFDTGDTCRLIYKTGPLFFGSRASADSWKVRGEFVDGPKIDEYLLKNALLEDAMAVPVAIESETESVACVVPKKPETACAKVWAESEISNEIMGYCESGRTGGTLDKHIKIKKIIVVEKIELGDTGKRSRKKTAEAAQKYIDEN